MKLKNAKPGTRVQCKSSPRFYGTIHSLIDDGNTPAALVFWNDFTAPSGIALSDLRRIK